MPAAAPIPTFVEKTLPLEEPAPAGLSSFLVEFPMAALVESASIADAATNLEPTPGLAATAFAGVSRTEATADRLDPAGRIPLELVSTMTDIPTPQRERGLELREFVRGVPPVEIRLRPARETGFEPVREALEMDSVAMSSGSLVSVFGVSFERAGVRRGLPALGPRRKSCSMTWLDWTLRRPVGKRPGKSRRER